MTQPTAEIRIRVHPIGTPGQVILEVADVGRVELTNDEVAVILLQAYDTVTRRDPPADT